MKEGILPGALVRCSNNKGRTYSLTAGQLYTVSGTQFYGAYVYLVGLERPYRSERFELLYNVEDYFTDDWYTEGSC